MNISPDFTYRVRWQRESNGTCVPYMYEPAPKSPKLGKWVRYNQSKAYRIDAGCIKGSDGYVSFQNALKMGYVNEGKVESLAY